MRHDPVESVGTRFGKLVVIDVGDQFAPRKEMRFLCRCDCGSEKTVARYHLRAGAINDCGCAKSNKASIDRRKRPPAEAEFNEHYTRYKRSAAKRGIEFRLSEEEFILCSSGDCKYCGAPPVEFVSRFMHDKPLSGYAANGIDRVDNKIGYIVGNVVPCCGFCNMAKGTRSAEQFIGMCIAIANHSTI